MTPCWDLIDLVSISDFDLLCCLMTLGRGDLDFFSWALFSFDFVCGCLLMLFSCPSWVFCLGMRGVTGAGDFDCNLLDGEALDEGVSSICTPDTDEGVGLFCCGTSSELNDTIWLVRKATWVGFKNRSARSLRLLLSFVKKILDFLIASFFGKRDVYTFHSKWKLKNKVSQNMMSNIFLTYMNLFLT